jgi:hypothetical protein
MIPTAVKPCDYAGKHHKWQRHRHQVQSEVAVEYACPDLLAGLRVAQGAGRSHGCEKKRTKARKAGGGFNTGFKLCAHTASVGWANPASSSRAENARFSNRRHSRHAALYLHAEGSPGQSWSRLSLAGTLAHALKARLSS